MDFKNMSPEQTVQFIRDRQAAIQRHNDSISESTARIKESEKNITELDGEIAELKTVVTIEKAIIEKLKASRRTKTSEAKESGIQ